jgi:hypothetical protein
VIATRLEKQIPCGNDKQRAGQQEAGLTNKEQGKKQYDQQTKQQRLHTVLL